MIFDTDILMRVQRSNKKAAGLTENDKDKHLSIMHISDKTHRQIHCAYILGNTAH